MMINTTQFQKNCLDVINQVYEFHTEVVITKRGKPLVKLVALQSESPKPFIGSLTGVGETSGDLLAPFEEEWEDD